LREKINYKVRGKKSIKSQDMAGITKLRNFEENQIPNEEKVVKVSMFQRERLKWFHWLEIMTERMARMRCKSFLEMPFTAKHVLQLGEQTRLVYVSYKSKGRGVRTATQVHGWSPACY
jgi:hypothetical protein